jgi:hypothetical protein
MEPVKSFNNVIIGQFVLTKVPVKVYVDNRYLTITDVDDVDDPEMGFGMDEDGAMQHFEYQLVQHLLINGNEITLDVYKKGMEDKFAGDDGSEKKEEPKEDEETKKEESTMKLGELIKEISQEEVDAEIEGASAAIDAAKAKKKAADAAFKDTVKKSKDKIKAAKAQMKVAEEGVVKEDHQEYRFGSGDIVKNINTKCPHHGSIGVVKKIMDLPMKGTVAVYTVMNSGDTYKPGMSLAKTVDQLEPIQKPDTVEDEI